MGSEIMVFSVEMQNLTLAHRSSTNKNVILSDRYDQGRHGLSVGWETPLVVFYKITSKGRTGGDKTYRQLSE